MPTNLKQLSLSHNAAKPFGVTSVCSAHPLVIRAAARTARRYNEGMLIEATCNQVNQFGGYTGMRPSDFVALVTGIAAEEGVPSEKVIFGGDHLGPNPWRREDSRSAMAKAEEMVTAYVTAGFRKIHLDASMGCAGEPAALDDAVTAERSAQLVKAAEAAAEATGRDLPEYIIGTEVPPPGGADHALTAVQPTSDTAAQYTIDVHRQVFRKHGLEDALSRVVALVVQPGVEFGNENVVFYERAKARRLVQLLDREPALVFEAHSTDYQRPSDLRELVEDGFAILKVGPQLTFVLRQAFYGLDLVASDFLPDYGERPLFRTMEKLMLAEPEDWLNHYRGSEAYQRVQRHYSLSDRIRYYWTKPEAASAVAHLMTVLRGAVVPSTLFWQHLSSFEALAGRPLDPDLLVVTAVEQVLETYRQACTQQP
jgi:D-tagatose 6-phosphate 4-epimerase